MGQFKQIAISRQIAIQNAEDLHRLAAQAERAGVRILVDHTTGAHIATSATDATACYAVSVVGGCGCRGYTYWGRCTHHSLLLAQLGVLPDQDPPPALGHGLSDTQLVILKADAMKRHALYGEPLVNPVTGETIAA
jgi:hypothetical protein